SSYTDPTAATNVDNSFVDGLQDGSVTIAYTAVAGATCETTTTTTSTTTPASTVTAAAVTSSTAAAAAAAELPRTGGGGPVALIGLGVLGVGIVLALVRRRYPRSV
ncbi:MAG TPA: LPXTG cell wall anchor domain-containing protein, partial [Acidimicrobiia bacterium]|nr:LPXTG cell wall anchor domain-containing protein [Acidimicrobiia bacterium]